MVGVSMKKAWEHSIYGEMVLSTLMDAREDASNAYQGLSAAHNRNRQPEHLDVGAKQIPRHALVHRVDAGGGKSES
jgi:hypothetical protein